ncbi:hypothetical protein Tco_0481215 [Tanacetum coccineum]
MAELISEEYIVNSQNESNLSITSNDINIELSNKFLEELRKSAYYGWIDEDVVNHMAKVLEMINLIYIPVVDSHQLRMKHTMEKRFVRTTRQLGIDPTWNLYSRVNSSFVDKHMKMDGRTKKVLFHAWMNGSWNKRRMDDRILSSNDTTTDSFFRPYLKTSEKNKTEKDNELSLTKCKCSNISNSIDEQSYKRICKAEKFEAIKYSLGPNEGYIAIRRCEYDAWERNKDRMSIIYQEIFQKKDEG